MNTIKIMLGPRGVPAIAAILVSVLFGCSETKHDSNRPSVLTCAVRTKNGVAEITYNFGGPAKENPLTLIADTGGMGVEVFDRKKMVCDIDVTRIADDPMSLDVTVSRSDASEVQVFIVTHGDFEIDGKVRGDPYKVGDGSFLIRNRMGSVVTD